MDDAGGSAVPGEGAGARSGITKDILGWAESNQQMAVRGVAGIKPTPFPPFTLVEIGASREQGSDGDSEGRTTVNGRSLTAAGSICAFSNPFWEISERFLRKGTGENRQNSHFGEGWHQYCDGKL